MTGEAELLLPATGSAPEGCPGCAGRVAARVRVLPGVSAVRVDPETLRLRYAYELDVVTPEQVETAARDLLVSDEDRWVHRVLAIEGMDCADCARTLERGVGRLAGVGHAAVNFGAARLTVEYDRASTDLDTIDARVRELGYRVSQPEAAPPSERRALWDLVRRRDNLLALVAGVFTLAGALAAFASAPAPTATILWALAVLSGGAPLATRGWRTLRATRGLDINLLMTVAVLGAAAIGDWFEAATVVFLFSLGEALEGYAMDRVRRSVRALLSLAPPTALVRRGALDVELPASEVTVGDLVVVRAGTRVPLDGVVDTGASSVDQSSLTGESLPVAKATGDALYAGTLNGSSPLTMRVTRLAGDSSVAKVIRLVEHAQAQRAPAQQLVDRFARVYTPAVVAGALAVATVPPLVSGDWLGWLERALVLLVISCPCALVLSTPISIVSALSAAARHGVLIKGGVALERAGQIDTVAFDKTGTLTRGEPEVTGVTPLDGLAEDELLALAATIERYSEHPLGRALLRAAQERGLPVDEAHDMRVEHGAGVIATVGGREVRAGSARLFDPAANTAAVRAAVERAEREGGTSVLVGTREQVLGVIGFADTARPDAPDALADLRAAGVSRIAMLSGDREAAVRRIADAVGIATPDARSGLLPEQKLAAIGDLRADGRVVAMVGDGVNDAPALAAADIGVAMGVAGTDAAVETADVALMGDDLRGLAAAIRLGRRARRIIAVNIAFSIATKLVFLALAVTGHATLWMAIVADMGTSLLVIANALRLLRWPGPRPPSLSS